MTPKAITNAELKKLLDEQGKALQQLAADLAKIKKQQPASLPDDLSAQLEEIKRKQDGI